MPIWLRSFIPGLYFALQIAGTSWWPLQVGVLPSGRKMLETLRQPSQTVRLSPVFEAPGLRAGSALPPGAGGQEAAMNEFQEKMSKSCCSAGRLTVPPKPTSAGRTGLSWIAGADDAGAAVGTVGTVETGGEAAAGGAAAGAGACEAASAAPARHTAGIRRYDRRPERIASPLDG